MNMQIQSKIIIIFLIIMSIFTGAVMSKYVVQEKKEALYEAENFYFESDLLTEAGVKIYTYQKGANYIEIMLKNNADSLRYSNVDIDYTVELTDLEGKEVKDKNGNTVEAISGKLIKGSINTKTERFENLTTGSYIVTAKAVKPYEKIIKANFVITEADTNISYEAKDVVDSPVVQLTISNKDYNGNIRVTWPSGTTPDNTDTNFTDNSTSYTGGSKIVSILPNSEYIIQFFKENPSLKYTTEQFEVERSN